MLDDNDLERIRDIIRAELGALRPRQSAAADPLRGRLQAALAGVDRTTIRRALVALGVPPGEQTRGLTSRAGQALLELGWRYAGRLGPKGGRERWYARGA